MADRKIRVLVAKPGLDGHDVGAKIIARSLIQAGFEVTYTGLRKSPEEVIKRAREVEADVIGLSLLSGSHMPFCKRFDELRKKSGLEKTLWLVGGVIPEEDQAGLKELGVDGIFPVGTGMAAVADLIREKLPGAPASVAVNATDKPETPALPVPPSPTSAVPSSVVINESGIEVKPLYTGADVEESGGFDRVGQPGEFPFTRGIHKQMYRKRPWTMRQYAGFGAPEETNGRFRYLIENGQTGLNVAFDLPTQVGLDSDDPMAHGEVGRVGMAVDTLKDFEIAFEGIDLDRVTVSLTINGSAAALIAMYFALAEKRGYDVKKLRGTAQNDILKEFIGRGTWVFPVEPSIKLVGDTILYCAEHAPLYSPVSVCGYHIRESGADPVREIAYAFCIAKAYIDHTISRGLKIDEFASRLSFNFDIYGNLFEQVSKFRAARRLWATIIRDDYKATDPRSMWMRMIAGGGGAGLTIEQPENNIVRGAYYALISALSGTQTMALCCYDEAYTIPSEKASRISLRTMQILIEEMGLCDTVDPLAGSYYVETMTNQMEDRIKAAISEIDAQGGIVQSVSDGKVQDAVSKQALERVRKLESGQTRKVGVNCYRMEEEERTVEFHPFNEEACAKQVERLETVKASRDSAVVERALGSVRTAAAAGHNVMPPIIEAVKAYATVGELTKCLVEVYGRYDEPVCLTT